MAQPAIGRESLCKATASYLYPRSWGHGVLIRNVSYPTLVAITYGSPWEPTSSSWPETHWDPVLRGFLVTVSYSRAATAASAVEEVLAFIETKRSSCNNLAPKKRAANDKTIKPSRRRMDDQDDPSADSSKSNRLHYYSKGGGKGLAHRQQADMNFCCFCGECLFSSDATEDYDAPLTHCLSCGRSLPSQDKVNAQSD